MAMIDDTYIVKLPNGKLNEVNIFDMNLALASLQGDKLLGTNKTFPYIQLEDSAWIRIDALKIVRSTREDRRKVELAT